MRRLTSEGQSTPAMQNAVAAISVRETPQSFNAVVKIADASGIPLEDYKAQATQDLREALGLERFNNGAGE